MITTVFFHHNLKWLMFFKRILIKSINYGKTWRWVLVSILSIFGNSQDFLTVLEDVTSRLTEYLIVGTSKFEITSPIHNAFIEGFTRPMNWIRSKGKHNYPLRRELVYVSILSLNHTDVVGEFVKSLNSRIFHRDIAEYSWTRIYISMVMYLATP